MHKHKMGERFVNNKKLILRRVSRKGTLLVGWVRRVPAETLRRRKQIEQRRILIDK